MGVGPLDNYYPVIQGNRVPLDGMTIALMRERFLGQYKGFSELERMLDQLESELRELIKQRENENKAK